MAQLRWRYIVREIGTGNEASTDIFDDGRGSEKHGGRKASEAAVDQADVRNRNEGVLSVDAAEPRIYVQERAIGHSRLGGGLAVEMVQREALTSGPRPVRHHR
jgi:hypothetical protein